MCDRAGQRQPVYETQLAYLLSGLEAEQGDRMVALDYLAVAVRNHHESGDFGMVHNPLAMLASVLDRFGRTDRRPPLRVSQGSIP